MSGVWRETTWRQRIKQNKEKIDKNRNRRSQPQSAIQLSEYLIFKDTLGFHYQKQLFSASCYMLRNKDNYNVGNIIFLTIYHYFLKMWTLFWGRQAVAEHVDVFCRLVGG